MARPQGIPSTVVRGARPSLSVSRVLLEFVQYLCLLIAFVCLGYVALIYAHTVIFQAYQNWRFDQVLHPHPPSQKTSMVEWTDHAFAAFMKGPVAPRSQGTVQAHTPSLADGESPPPSRILPNGFLIGRMDIPRIGISVMVLEGDDDGVLQKAVGHIPTTSFPGGPGNVAIAGHRDTFFRALRDIRKDDEITLTTMGGVYNYRVGRTEKVSPKDVQVLTSSPRPTLTLITCYPFDYIGPAPERFVVQAWETQSSTNQ